MPFAVVATSGFIKDLKAIYKKHKGILSDIEKLSAQLKESPDIGIDLGQNLYKIRLAISGTGKGKSGGARVITCVIFISGIVFLSEIYLKNERDTVDVNKVIQKIRDEGLI